MSSGESTVEGGGREWEEGLFQWKEEGGNRGHES